MRWSAKLTTTPQDFIKVQDEQTRVVLGPTRYPDTAEGRVTNSINKSSGRRDAPWTVNPTFQPGRIIPLHDNLSVLPGVDETRPDGGVPINITGETCSITQNPGCTSP